MTVDIERLGVETSATVFTENFAVHARMDVELEGNVLNHWLIGEDGTMLTINPDADEMFLLKPTDAEMDRDDGVVVFGGKDYEFTYEDRGAVQMSEGETPFDDGDELEFSDYEAANGERIRVITNAYNGEESVYTGVLVTDEDIIINES